MKVNVKDGKLKECVMDSGIEIQLNGWSWAGLVVARLSMGVSEGRKQEHDVDLQCMRCSDCLGGQRASTGLSKFLLPSSLGGFWLASGRVPEFQGFHPSVWKGTVWSWFAAELNHVECVLSVIVSTGPSGPFRSGMWASVLILSVVYLCSNLDMYVFWAI